MNPIPIIFLLTIPIFNSGDVTVSSNTMIHDFNDGVIVTSSSTTTIPPPIPNPPTPIVSIPISDGGSISFDESCKHQVREYFEGVFVDGYDIPSPMDLCFDVVFWSDK